MIGPDEQRRREIDEEIDAHLQARVDHLVARGMSPDAARAEALRRFGDLGAGRARLLAQAAADGRRRRLRDRAEALWQDGRYVARSLARQPVFALGVIATLTLGLGINAAVFRVADRVLLRPPDGVRDPGGLRYVEASVGGASVDPSFTRTAHFGFLEARRIADAGAFAGVSINTPPRIVTGQASRDLAVAYVDAAFFTLLGVAPAAGRFFDAPEGEPGAGIRVAVVSHGYWQHEMAAAPIASAPEITVGTRTFHVIGVAPRSFTGIDLDPADLWLPLGVADFGRGFANGVEIPWYRTDMARAVRVTGRLAGTDAGGAIAAAKVAAAMSTGPGRGGLSPNTPVPELTRVTTLRPLVPVGGVAVSDASQRLLARLSIVSAIVLLIACANAMHLLLARGARRHREIATRMALGASRWRVWRLLMVESVLLAAGAGIAAAVVGGWTSTALRQLIFPDSRWTTPALDGRSMLFTIALALVAGLAAGVGPALQATSPNLVNAIKTGRLGSPRRARATRGALLIAQTTLSIVLLIASGLLIRSLVRLSVFDLGFDAHDLVTVSIPAPFPGDANARSPQVDAFMAQLRATEPGIEIASATPAPFGAMKVSTVMVPGSTFVPGDRETPRVMDVSPNYFAVMRTRAVWGRLFTAEDLGESVAIVNETMARNYWGPTIPPGACVLLYGSPCRRIVGVVEDANDAPGVAAAPMRYYLPLPDAQPGGTVVIRTRDGEAAALAARVKAALPPTPRPTIDVAADRLARVLRPWRTATALFVMLGVTALTLACLGIYSIMSYTASERVHELGIRVALGASAGDVLRLVIGGGLRLAVAGGLAGLAAAAAGGHLLSSLLYDVSPFDPMVYAAAFVFMTAAGAASMLPAALRAARVDAVVALRE